MSERYHEFSVELDKSCGNHTSNAGKRRRINPRDNDGTKSTAPYRLRLCVRLDVFTTQEDFSHVHWTDILRNRYENVANCSVRQDV
jgi:hypothetical protein